MGPYTRPGLPMLPLLLAFLSTGHAAEHRLGVAAGGHASTGLKTHLPVYGAEGGLSYTLQGDKNGLHVELQDIYGVSPSGPAHLPGLRLGWSRLYGQSATRAYSVLGAGAYLNDVLPLLQVLWVEGGVELDRDALAIHMGPQIYALPPFFVGGGARLTVSYKL